MSTFWKVMVGLLLTLPIGAYVTGSLVASEAEMPSERTPIVISDVPSDEASNSKRPDSSEKEKSPGKAQSPAIPNPPASDDDDGGVGGTGGGDDGVAPGGGGDDGDAGDDDGGVKVVRPTPQDLGGDDDDYQGGGDDSDDGGGEGDDDD